MEVRIGLLCPAYTPTRPLPGPLSCDPASFEIARRGSGAHTSEMPNLLGGFNSRGEQLNSWSGTALPTREGFYSGQVDVRLNAALLLYSTLKRDPSVAQAYLASSIDQLSRLIQGGPDSCLSHRCPHR
jgi:hypothetical protein